MELFNSLIEWDRELLVNINSLNAPFFDNVMWWISDRFVWIPLYLSIVFFLFKVKGKDAIIAALAVGLCVLIADQVASGFCKPFFERLRPTHDPQLKDILHMLKCNIQRITINTVNSIISINVLQIWTHNY